MRKLLNYIKIILSTLFFVAGIIAFLSALGWNDEYVGHQIGGNMGDAIANLGQNSQRSIQIVPMLFIALIYPLIALLQLDFQPFVIVYIYGIGGCMVCLILSITFASLISED